MHCIKSENALVRAVRITTRVIGECTDASLTVAPFLRGLIKR